MEIDYSPFLHVHDDGSIWWSLLDAIKLGAGYLPQRGDARNPVPVLMAMNGRIFANERTLDGMFGITHAVGNQPHIVARNGQRCVEAQEFLFWLSRYLEKEPDSAFPFPAELARAVKMAKDARGKAGAVAHDLVNLTVALDSWFDKPLGDLPDDLKERVEKEIFMPPWDAMSASQRRTCAMAEDERRDSKHVAEQTFWWDWGVRHTEIENTIKEWNDDRHASAEVRLERERQLPELKRELAMLRRQMRVDECGQQSFSLKESTEADVDPGSVVYVAYPKALSDLARRFGASPDELAAWVFMGPKLGGLAAYVNANELVPPPRFHYGLGVGNERDFDYITPLMSCWFREDELLAFDASERYLTGKTLIERWGNIPGNKPEAFISAKIRESALLEFHPITGSTQATEVGDQGYPPVTDGLFVLAHVLAIEAKQFGDGFIPPPRSNAVSVPKPVDDAPVSLAVPVPAVGAELSLARTDSRDDACAVFREMVGLSAQEITIAFVGDTSETGLAANNLLEISARGTSRRVALAEFGLVNRTQGVLNAQAAVLVGLTRQFKLDLNARNQQKMSRLRRLLRHHLGIRDDPFEEYRTSIGWAPRFAILDRRGAADERAKQEALRKTSSLDQEFEGRAAIDSGERGGEDFEDEDDEAGQWLDKR